MIVRKSELNSIKSSICGALNLEATEANMLSTTINQSITVLQQFEGDFIDKIKLNLDSYKNAMNKRRELSSELSGKISGSLNILIDAMGIENEIDTSKKEELKATLREIEIKISSLQQKLSACAQQYIVSEMKAADYDQIRGMNRTIQVYQGQCRQLETEILKIEKIEQADAEAHQNLSGLDDLISAYKTLASEIEAQKSNIPTSIPTVALAASD